MRCAALCQNPVLKIMSEPDTEWEVVSYDTPNPNVTMGKPLASI